MSNRGKYPDSEPIQNTTYGEDNEHRRIESGDILKELRRSGSHMKELDDYLEEFEEDDCR